MGEERSREGKGGRGKKVLRSKDEGEMKGQREGESAFTQLSPWLDPNPSKVDQS